MALKKGEMVLVDPGDFNGENGNDSGWAKGRLANSNDPTRKAGEHSNLSGYFLSIWFKNRRSIIVALLVLKSILVNYLLLFSLQ